MVAIGVGNCLVVATARIKTNSVVGFAKSLLGPANDLTTFKLKLKNKMLYGQIVRL